jgi:hypothetical protein
MKHSCLWCCLNYDDELLARSILGTPDRACHDDIRKPDLIIAPAGGDPYLFRWELIRNTKVSNVYLHIQVSSDPERPLHDHPWDNFSVILSGGYDELWDPHPSSKDPEYDMSWPHDRKFRKGDTIFRRAVEAHRLILPAEISYTMTLFSTGPKIRDWGFWYPDGWRKSSG